MKRNSSQLAWTLVVALVFVTTSKWVVAAERPDVLMIVVDDLRPMLGCYGNPHVQTPNLDRLARRSVLFQRAYCQYAKCGTSRLSLMTGLRPDAIDVFSNRDQDVRAFRSRRPDAISLSKWLGDHGYFTQSFGKIDHDGWDVPTDWSTPPAPGRPQEILEIADPSDVTKPTVIADRLACPAIQSPEVPDEHLFAGRMTGQVMQAIDSHPSDQPVFFAVGYRRPHLPLVAPQRYFDLYAPDESWLAPNPEPAAESPVMAWFNSDAYVGSADRIGLRMPKRPDRSSAIEWNGYELRSYLGVPNQGPIERSLQLKILQAYAACVSYVDAQVGRLLDHFEASGRLDNCVILFCSDHGWHLGEQSAWSKMTNFEIATRVPLLISAPGIEPASTQSLAELVDLYPTICELAGVPAPPHLEGESLVASLREPQLEKQTFALSQHARFSEKFMGRALRTDRFRFVKWTETESGQTVNYELYDHHVDPHETKNVADDARYLDHLRQLESIWHESFPRSGSPQP